MSTPLPAAPMLRLNQGTPELMVLGTLQAGAVRYEAGPDAEAAYQAAVLRGWRNNDMPQAEIVQLRLEWKDAA